MRARWPPARSRAAAEQAAAKEARARQLEAEQDPERSVVPWLRRLGCSLDEARRAATHRESISDAPLEQQVREAIRFLTSSHGPIARTAA